MASGKETSKLGSPEPAGIAAAAAAVKVEPEEADSSIWDIEQLLHRVKQEEGAAAAVRHSAGSSREGGQPRVVYVPRNCGVDGYLAALDK